MSRKPITLMVYAIFVLVISSVESNKFPFLSHIDAQEPEKTIKIGGSNWGVPTPYSFFPRGPGYVRMTFLFDTLTWLDEEGIIPWLAADWHSSEDGKTWTVTLVENAIWHDGEPLTAQDVVFTFEYFAEFPHPWFDVSLIERVELGQTREVIFHLKRPYAVFTTRILSRVPIIPQHIWSKVDNPYTYVDDQAFIGSGPFLLEDYDEVQGSYLYVANPDFFLGQSKVDRIIFVPTNTEDVSLLNGDIDMARILDVNALAPFQNNSEFRILTAPDNWLFRLVINFNNPLMNNLEFRQALAHAIDRQEMVTRIAHGGAVIGTYGYISPISEWHNPNVVDYSYDPDRASEILDSLNIIDRNGDGIREQPNGDELTIVLLSDNRFDRVAEAVEIYLEAVGLNVQITSADVSTHDTLINEMRDFDLALNAHGGISGDLGNLTTGLPAISGYTNPEFQALIQEQPFMIDPEQRRQALWRVQEIIADDVATIPLYYLNWYHVFRPSVFEDWFYTKYGLPDGVQLIENKYAFIR